MKNRPVDGAPKMRFHKAIMEKGTDTVIFAIPDSADEKEKEGVLRKQITDRLVVYANMFQSYDRAIEECQGYLKALIHHYPEEAELVRRTAELGGQDFLALVGKAKKRNMKDCIRRGEMFLGVKNVGGGKDAKRTD